MNKIIEILRIDFDKDRIYGLDILRTLSILFVVAGHSFRFLPTKDNLLGYFIFDGVSIFFVLSGFLIGNILIKILETKKATFETLFDFYIRRWFRTLPNYFLILSLQTALTYMLAGSFRFDKVYKYFFFSQNLFTPHPSFFPEAWSISVEEWFYLVIPAILFTFIGILRIPVKKTILATAITVLLLVVFFRYFRYSNTTITSIREWDLLFRKQVATRLDSIMFGLIGAYISYYHKSFWIQYKNIFFILGIAIFITTKIIDASSLNRLGLYFCVFSFMVTSTGTLFLLPYLSNLKTGGGIVYISVTYISIISYSMYLVNLPVRFAFQIWDTKTLSVLKLSEILHVTLIYSSYWAVTIIVSIILYKYFEKPVMNLRDKIK